MCKDVLAKLLVKSISLPPLPGHTIKLVSFQRTENTKIELDILTAQTLNTHDYLAEDSLSSYYSVNLWPPIKFKKCAWKYYFFNNTLTANTSCQ